MYINTDNYRFYIPKYNIDSKHNGHIIWVENDINTLVKNSVLEIEHQETPGVTDLPSLETPDGANYDVKIKDDASNVFISSDDIISYYGFMSGNGSAPLRYVLRDVDANCKISTNTSIENLQMRYSDCLMRVTATQTDNIVFHPDGLELNQQGDSNTYSFHMVRNNVPTDTSFHTIDVSGKSANKLTFSYENGEWYLSGDCLENIEVQANHSEATSNTLIFSVPAGYDTVCLRQVGDTIAAFVKANGDEGYETPVGELPLGDVNADGVVDSLDAAQILIAAALVGADMDSGLTGVQKIAADTSKNGTFGAEDAALVLQYAAAVGSGYTESFEDFLAA